MTTEAGQHNDFPSEFLDLWRQAQPYTMTSQERGYALWSAVNTVLDQDLPGALVECGVWRGGSAMLMALTLLQRGVANREIILFDTFTGMTEPGPEDQDLHGHMADDLMRNSQGEDIAALVRAEAPLDEVRALLESTGYDQRLLRFIKGDVRETLTRTQTLRIALLRLDTDFYDSTLAELRELYPRMTQGGVLIIDDYGHWSGARKAVEDYFSDASTPFQRPMLWRLDYTGRGGTKAEEATRIEIKRYDYIPVNMDPPDLSSLFPDAEPSDPWPVEWPYLRKSIPHIWRRDTRPTRYVTGNASVEEAACLYHFACQFSGKRGLEIGTHYGWTAAHLLAAGLRLDCIDPAFQDDPHRRAVDETLKKVAESASHRLWDGFSPDCIGSVRNAEPSLWSFAFIDGNHDGDAPRDDARAVLPFLADDAMVVFHDLTSPNVEAGLAVYREAGFETRLINTMQVLGVAWRGNVVPPEHDPDPNVTPLFQEHLIPYIRKLTGGCPQVRRHRIILKTKTSHTSGTESNLS